MDGGTVETGGWPQHHERSERHSVAPGDRSSDGIDPCEVLLVGNGIAPGACQDEIGLERLRICNGLRREAIIIELSSKRAGEGGLLKREQSLAGRGAVDRHTPADRNQHAQAAARALFQINHTVTVEAAKCDRFPEFGRKAFEFGGGGADEVEFIPHTVRKLDEAVSEQISARCLVLPDQTKHHQRLQHARKRRLRHAAHLLQVSEAQRLRSLRYEVEESETLGEGGRTRRCPAIFKPA